MKRLKLLNSEPQTCISRPQSPSKIMQHHHLVAPEVFRMRVRGAQGFIQRDWAHSRFGLQGTAYASSMERAVPGVGPAMLLTIMQNQEQVSTFVGSAGKFVSKLHVVVCKVQSPFKTPQQFPHVSPGIHLGGQIKDARPKTRHDRHGWFRR